MYLNFIVVLPLVGLGHIQRDRTIVSSYLESTLLRYDGAESESSPLPRVSLSVICWSTFGVRESGRPLRPQSKIVLT